MRGALQVTILGLFALGGCNNPPPRAWLRYEPKGAHGWETAASGRLATTLMGCRMEIDLNRRETRVEVIAANTTGQDLDVRVGPEATRDAQAAIGEVQRRPLDNRPGEEVLDFVPYVSMQPLELRHGWRATFDLDSPLGRDPTLGQYFVLVVEVRDPTGAMERKLLPLTATNSGATSRTTDG